MRITKLVRITEERYELRDIGNIGRIVIEDDGFDRFRIYTSRCQNRISINLWEFFDFTNLEILKEGYSIRNGIFERASPENEGFYARIGSPRIYVTRRFSHIDFAELYEKWIISRYSIPEPPTISEVLNLAREFKSIELVDRKTKSSKFIPHEISKHLKYFQTSIFYFKCISALINLARSNDFSISEKTRSILTTREMIEFRTREVRDISSFYFRPSEEPLDLYDYEAHIFTSDLDFIRYEYKGSSHGQVSNRILPSLVVRNEEI